MADESIKGFNDDLAERILRSGRESSYAEGETIFAEGDQASFLPAVISGRVKMVRYPEPGKEVIIGTFAAGEVFAIPPALDGKRFPSTAVAMEPSVILKVPRDKFLRLLGESHEFSSVIMQRMCGILRDRSETIHVLAKQSAEQRIAKLLISIIEKDKPSLPYRVTLRRQDLAEMSGLTLESTIRTIRKLADRGSVRIDRGKVVVDDKRTLERVLES